MTYESGRANEAAKNGVLHVLSGELPYLYNVYEALTTLSEYSGIGSFSKVMKNWNWMKIPVFRAALWMETLSIPIL